MKPGLAAAIVAFNTKGARRPKYGNRKVTVDGVTFDSVKESRRVSELKLLARAGEIRELVLQPEFELAVNGQLVCVYRADAAYVDVKTGLTVVEDVKSEATAKDKVYRIKIKLLHALTGIQVREV